MPHYCGFITAEAKTMIKPEPEEMGGYTEKISRSKAWNKSLFREEPLISLVAYFSKSLLHYTVHCGHKGHNTNKAQTAFPYCFPSDLDPHWHYKAWSWGLWPQAPTDALMLAIEFVP